MEFTFICPHCTAELGVNAELEQSDIACPNCEGLISLPRCTPGPGVTIGGFEIRSLLGKGAMGEVYLAHQLSMERDVALKILPAALAADAHRVNRFLKEVRMAARLDHPNIVRAFEAGEDHGIYFLAMAYVQGDTLERRLLRTGAMSETDALRIVRRLASALGTAWSEHQILHRDIKPANVILNQRGEPMLTDMGLSKRFDDTDGMTVTGAVLGTPNYMSPEQVSGSRELDTRSDMYSLGATLYTVLTGQIPFHGSSVIDTLRKQATEPLGDPREFNPNISDGCLALLERMLAKKPEERYRDWPSLAADVDQILDGQTPSLRNLPSGHSVLMRAEDFDAMVEGSVAQTLILDREPEKRPASRMPALLAGGLFGAVVCGVAVVSFVKTRQPDTPATVEVPAELGEQVQQHIEGIARLMREDAEIVDGIREHIRELRTLVKGTPFEGMVDKRLDRLRQTGPRQPRFRDGPPANGSLPKRPMPDQRPVRAQAPE